VKRALLAVIILLLLIGAAVLLLPSWASRSTPYVRDRILEALNARFASKVDVDVLNIDVYPQAEVSGEGLRLRYMGRTDIPPLIAIGAFDASAGIRGLFGRPVHLRNVTLERLDIRIPPGGLKGPNAPDTREPARRDVAPPPANAVATSGKRDNSPILIDRIESTQARLEIPSRRAGRLPRIFEIENLVMDGFGLPEGARFHAGVLNPVPKGRIETSGTFGPWDTNDPDQTPIRGEYAFKNANLDVIKGIGGILSSVGTYQGVLERVEVEGQTETPDFTIDIAGQPVPLTTRFKAVVDGTNGDTWLDRVEAKLAESTIVASGAVVRTQDVKGRRITLDLHVTKARLEDLLRLAVKARKPPLTGRVDLTTKFLLPAGSTSVIERLQLDGRFTLAQARFTNLDIQKKITLLSQRGRGDEEGDGAGESIVSNLRGRFALRKAQLSFAELAFSVPGASVELAGTYDLHAETMDFAGNLLTDASLADMTKGFKSILARVAQPFFRRPGGGSKLPIRISGTRTHPLFRLDVKRVFKRG
jgi:hypothetical protein